MPGRSSTPPLRPSPTGRGEPALPARRGLARRALFTLLTAAAALERHLRQRGYPASWVADAAGESSSGRFRSACVAASGPAPRESLAARLLFSLPRVRLPGYPPQVGRGRRRTALAGFASFAFLGGVLCGTVREKNAVPRGQAAIAAPGLAAPLPVTQADRAALMRCIQASNGPKRPDAMSAERVSPAEAGEQPWVVRAGAGAEPVVALTFDDGPHPYHTKKILATLKQERIPATFFLVGEHLERAPELARQALAHGHALGNHTWHHFYLDHMDAASTGAEIEITARLIENATGSRPAWFRPPGGYYTEDVLRVTRALGQRVALWSVDSRDWSEPGPEAIRRRVLAGLRPGAVILLHDSAAQTAAVLPRLIRDIRARGYRFATLDELARSSGERSGLGTGSSAPSANRVKTSR